MKKYILYKNNYDTVALFQAFFESNDKAIRYALDHNYYECFFVGQGGFIPLLYPETGFIPMWV